MSDSIPHGGSGHGYSYYGCRCDECCSANTKRVMRRRAERSREEIPVEHGLRSTYVNWRCRCGPCSEVHAEYCREYALRKKAES